MTEPDYKRAKLSVEVLPERPIRHFTENGDEILEEYSSSFCFSSPFPLTLSISSLVPHLSLSPRLILIRSEILPDQKFMFKVKQLDLMKTLKEGEFDKPEDEVEWHRQRQAVDHHLNQATAAVAQMVRLLQMLEEGTHATLSPITKPPAFASTELDELIDQIASKQKVIISFRLLSLSYQIIFFSRSNSFLTPPSPLPPSLFLPHLTLPLVPY